MLWVLVLALAGAVCAADEPHPLSDEYINYINSMNSTWKVSFLHSWASY
jgi:hypothetical protein